MLPLPAGSLAVVNESPAGGKVLIGRIKRKDGSFRVAPVAKSGKMTFAIYDTKNQWRFSVEESVNAKVSLLTVDE